jgi:hypothetical protein
MTCQDVDLMAGSFVPLRYNTDGDLRQQHRYSDVNAARHMDMRRQVDTIS